MNWVPGIYHNVYIYIFFFIHTHIFYIFIIYIYIIPVIICEAIRLGYTATDTYILINRPTENVDKSKACAMHRRFNRSWSRAPLVKRGTKTGERKKHKSWRIQQDGCLHPRKPTWIQSMMFFLNVSPFKYGYFGYPC